jgi:hypothetical protein
MMDSPRPSQHRESAKLVGQGASGKAFVAKRRGFKLIRATRSRPLERTEKSPSRAGPIAGSDFE